MDTKPPTRISLDLPNDLIEKIDKHIHHRPPPPDWPFKKRRIKRSRLSVKNHQKLTEYLEARKQYRARMEEFEENKVHTSRTSVVLKILTDALSA